MTSCAEQQSNDTQVVRKEWFQWYSKIIVDLGYKHITVILVDFTIKHKISDSGLGLCFAYIMLSHVEWAE